MTRCVNCGALPAEDCNPKTHAVASRLLEETLWTASGGVLRRVRHWDITPLDTEHRFGHNGGNAREKRSR